MVFVIDYFSNEEKHDFKDVIQLLALIKTSYPKRIKFYKHSITYTEASFEYRKLAERILIFERYQHTLRLKIECETHNDFFLVAQLFQSLCLIARYTLQTSLE